MKALIVSCPSSTLSKSSESAGMAFPLQPPNRSRTRKQTRVLLHLLPAHQLSSCDEQLQAVPTAWFGRRQKHSIFGMSICRPG